MKRSKRIAATLAVAAGMTMLGGVTAQADTTSVANKTNSSVANIAPTGAHGAIGPFSSRAFCLLKSHGKRCYVVGSKGWYFMP